MSKIEFIQGKTHINEMLDVFNNVSKSEYYLKQISFNELKGRINNEMIQDDCVICAKVDNEIVGYVTGYYKDSKGFLESILVKKEWQNKGVGKALLGKLEANLKNHGALSVRTATNYTWLIPNTDNHDHPNSPGIRINSPAYFFFLRQNYHLVAVQDAFHLDLAKFNISPVIASILEKNKHEGFVIELYQENVHHSLDEFYLAIDNPGFERSIKYNLGLAKPHPFLVVTDIQKRVLGWTGAIWNEDSGRGHFDGITVSPEVRNKGLGKALFSMLAEQSKINGAEFMTFYTGLTNPARYIYLSAGFQIAQTFGLLEKKL